MEPSAYADTVTFTNAPLPAISMSKARLVDASLSLFATPSNRVEVAFGTAGNGVLAPGEESFSFGWSNGAWFFSTPTNRVEGSASEAAARLTLSWHLRVREDGSPVSMSVDSEDVVLAAWTAHPPEWVFSRNWNAVRMTASGVDESVEAVSIRLDTDAGLLILR